MTLLAEQHEHRDIETVQQNECTPSGSGLWGVFACPKDISRTFGGGKRVGVGGYEEDPEEVARRDEETRQRLKRTRKILGLDNELESENAEAIDQARENARKLSARGSIQAAVDQLEAVKPFLSTGSERGAFAYLELAVAYESLPDGQSRAITIYKMLRGTPVKEVAQSAKQLLFGIDAMRNLDVQAYADSEESKLVLSSMKMDFSGVRASVYGGYANVYSAPRKMAKQPVRTTDEAAQILRQAMYGREDEWLPSERVWSALARLATEWAAGRSASEGAATCDLLDGQWEGVLEARDSQVSYYPAPQSAAPSPAAAANSIEDVGSSSESAEDAGSSSETQLSLTLNTTMGSVRRVVPVGPLRIRAELDGDFEWDPALSRLVARATSVRPPLLAPFVGGQWATNVLFADSELCVTREAKEGDAAVAFAADASAAGSVSAIEAVAAAASGAGATFVLWRRPLQELALRWRAEEVKASAAAAQRETEELVAAKERGSKVDLARHRDRWTSDEKRRRALGKLEKESAQPGKFYNP